MPLLETARLLLRPWTMDDVDALHCLWTNERVREFLWDGVEIPRERAEATVRFSVDTAERRGIGMWCVFPRESAAELIGFCGFRLMDDTENVEILFGLQPQYWGRGLALEAGRAALEYGFSARLFDKVYGRTDVPNRASARVLEKLGMRFEGETRIGELPTLCYSLARG